MRSVSPPPITSIIHLSLLHFLIVLLTYNQTGNLSTAIVSGILSSLSDSSAPILEPHTNEDLPLIPTRFVACVTRPSSAERVSQALSPLTSSLQIITNDNVRGARLGDILLLGCKPYHLTTVLGDPEIRDALKGKLLISILAGTPVEQIEETLYGPSSSTSKIPPSQRCRVIRVMPNIAALIQQSMTMIETPSPPLPSALASLIDWMFTRIGRIVYLPADKIDVSSALCGSGPANFALVLEGMIDGAVAMGLPRAEAQIMAAQTMRGCAGLVLNGEHPAILKEKVSTPGGCTIGGLLVLEEGAVRGTMAKSVREATVVAAQLGKGLKGVNGTRSFQ